MPQDTEVVNMDTARKILEGEDGILDEISLHKIAQMRSFKYEPTSEIKEAIATVLDIIEEGVPADSDSDEYSDEEDKRDKKDLPPRPLLRSIHFTDDKFIDDVKLAAEFKELLQEKLTEYRARSATQKREGETVKAFQEMVRESGAAWEQSQRYPGVLSDDRFYRDIFESSLTDKKFISTVHYGEREFALYSDHFPREVGADWKFPRNFPDYCRAMSEFCMSNYYDDVVLGETTTVDEDEALASVMRELWNQAGFPQKIDNKAGATALFQQIKKMAMPAFTRAAKDAQWDAVVLRDLISYNDTLTRLRYMEMCTTTRKVRAAVDEMIVDKMVDTLDDATIDGLRDTMDPDNDTEDCSSPVMQALFVQYLAESSHETHHDDKLIAFCGKCQEALLDE